MSISCHISKEHYFVEEEPTPFLCMAEGIWVLLACIEQC